MGTVGFKIQEIAHKYGLKLLVYFGSYGTEFYGDDSDIDIAYLAEDPLSIHEKMNLLRNLIIAHRKSEILSICRLQNRFCAMRLPRREGQYSNRKKVSLSGTPYIM